MDDRTLTELLARARIAELPHRYAVAATFNDADAIAALFDDEVDNGRWGIGREATRAYFRDAFSRSNGRQFFLAGTHQIDFDDDSTAHGVVMTRFSTDGIDGRGPIVVEIAYFDTYRRRGDDWYFLRRRETVGRTYQVVTAEVEAPSSGRRVGSCWDHVAP
jgi:hypothetical protein